MKNVGERIKDIMASVFGIDAALIDEDSSQDNIEQWDSIKTLDLVVSIEEEFDVSIPLEEVGNMTNFKYIRLILEELA